MLALEPEPRRLTFDATHNLSPFYTTGLQAFRQALASLTSLLFAPTRKEIDSRIAMFWPGMNSNMRLFQNNYGGDSGGLETVGIGMQFGQIGLFNGASQGTSNKPGIR